MKKKRFPRTKLQFIWDNIEGLRWLLIVAMLATVFYNVLQLTVPYFSQQIVDRYLTGENAATAYTNDKGGFYSLINAMIGITLFRAVIVYLDCMAYEHVSQRALYRIRNKLFEKIEHQDMHFYNEYRTGDLMTRLTGDLDAVRHNIAWVIRMIIECFALFTAVSIYFFSMNVKMALYILALAPVIFIIVFTFRKKVAPMHQLLREKHAQILAARHFVPVELLQEYRDQRGLPVIAVQDVGLEIDMLQDLQNGLAEERETLRVIEIAVQAFPAEIILVVQEIISHSVSLGRENAAVLRSPCQRHPDDLKERHLILEILGNILIQRENDAGINTLLYKRFGKGAGDVAESSGFDKGSRFRCGKQNFHIYTSFRHNRNMPAVLIASYRNLIQGCPWTELSGTSGNRTACGSDG